ncbi:hypothetical protein BBJ29_000265 [Phytophthora kernoviae]|uniref:Uncharacterized protein n=1 Tax=Phytophthora kernoviae TaxID=325452 RepID=A0A3F2S033_9STRA|nr:hypothetical protein BBJ29_000265 [Phytophthora kernoviae]RLN67715.1 hypothetical protein BBP00_00001474 [Phytophthora kernoviae]
MVLNTTSIDGDDAVYAAILARVEHPELTEQCQHVLQKEWKTINRPVFESIQEEEIELMSVKQEALTVVQVEVSSDSEVLDQGAEDESPMELEVLESSDEESAIELEVPDSDESALELDVLESESDEDFPSCLEVAIRLRKAGDVTQLKEFPAIVEQLRSYLQNKKHLTVAELDGPLFAHKNITSAEVSEVGRAIESMISVGMRLPLRPQIKSALAILLATVKQLELTLGELPAFLRP